MTNREAIIILKNEQPHCGDKIPLPESVRYEAFDKAIKLLEQNDSEIEIGDEVRYRRKSYDPHNGEKGVVIGVNKDWREVRFLSSWSSIGVPKEHLTKTGRHFPQIAEVLKQMEDDIDDELQEDPEAPTV